MSVLFLYNGKGIKSLHLSLAAMAQNKGTVWHRQCFLETLASFEADKKGF